MTYATKFTLRENSGSLFRNDRKEKETQADYRGEAMIDGQLYWMDAWLRTADSGRKWMSFSFKPKEAVARVEQQARPSKPVTHAEMKRGGRDDGKSLAEMDDDLPDF